MEFKQIIRSEEELRIITGEPHQIVIDKVQSKLDSHCRTFIARSPFVAIASIDSFGNMDISPKGDPPGFVAVLDDHTLAIPDRRGNRRHDTFTNVLQNPSIALYFLVPGVRDTLRVSGSAKLVRDIELRKQFEIKETIPDFVLVVEVSEVFFQCAKCVIRSDTWNPESWSNASDVPSLGRILKDHAHLDDSEDEIDEAVELSYKSNLY